MTSSTTQLTSPIHCAVNFGHTECLRILAENGFDPDLHIGTEMMAPVHAAIRSAGIGSSFPGVLERCMKTLRALLEVNANFETPCYGRDYFGFVNSTESTPFEYALSFGMFGVAHFLADVVGANIQSIRPIYRRHRHRMMEISSMYQPSRSKMPSLCRRKRSMTDGDPRTNVRSTNSLTQAVCAPSYTALPNV